MRPRALASAAVILAAALLIVSCSGDAPEVVRPTPDPDSPARTFAMGLSSLPAELTQESYEQAFALAANAGEVILIQRTPPWSELIGGGISEETASATEREIDLAANYGLDIFVAVDPIDVVGGESEVADLPPELRGAGFGDERVHDAFVAYASYVARNYQPRYLALGVEVNSYQQHHPEDFERFVVLYHETYEAVKEISPETLVFPTFQFEEMQGLLPPDDPLPPQWYLLNRFGTRMDLLAVSSFPSLAYERAELIPDSYYARLRAYSDAPIALTGIGYPSQRGEGESAEEDQAAYLMATLEVAQQVGMPLVVWFIGQDPGFASDSTQAFLAKTGLRAQDGSAKPSWSLWESTSRRPLQPQPTATPDDEEATETPPQG